MKSYLRNGGAKENSRRVFKRDIENIERLEDPSVFVGSISLARIDEIEPSFVVF